MQWVKRAMSVRLQIEDAKNELTGEVRSHTSPTSQHPTHACTSSMHTAAPQISLRNLHVRSSLDTALVALVAAARCTSIVTPSGASACISFSVDFAPFLMQYLL